LDIGIGDAGAVGELGNEHGGLVLDEGEHVFRGLAQVFVGCDFGERDLMWEPVDSERISYSKRAWNVAFVAPIVFWGGAYIPSVYAVRGHVVTLFWCGVDDDMCSWGSEGTFIEIEIAVEAGVG
jgi:hypothetical protein